MYYEKKSYEMERLYPFARKHWDIALLYYLLIQFHLMEYNSRAKRMIFFSIKFGGNDFFDK